MLANAATTGISPKPRGILKAEPLCVPDGPPPKKKPHRVQWNSKSQLKSGKLTYTFCVMPIAM